MVVLDGLRHVDHVHGAVPPQHVVLGQVGVHQVRHLVQTPHHPHHLQVGAPELALAEAGIFELWCSPAESTAFVSDDHGVGIGNANKHTSRLCPGNPSPARACEAQSLSDTEFQPNAV
jgi:hypothetical protein